MLAHIPWMNRFLNLLPMPTDFEKVFRFAADRLKARTAKGATSFPDICSWRVGLLLGIFWGSVVQMSSFDGDVGGGEVERSRNPDLADHAWPLIVGVLMDGAADVGGDGQPRVGSEDEVLH